MLGKRSFAGAVAGVALLAFGLLAAPHAAARAAPEETTVNDDENTEIDWALVEMGDEITVTGKVGVFGSEPHVFLALVVPDDERESGARLVEISGDLEAELWEHQGDLLTVTGKVLRLEIGPGFPLRIDASEYREAPR